jgi:inhibitor of KinA sporulation pathway (predicted exonuclease)
MSNPHPEPPGESPITPAEAAKEIRRLLHDMNNALEIIIQATYLVGTVEMTDETRQWVKLLEQGVDQAAKLNRELRDFIRKTQEDTPQAAP